MLHSRPRVRSVRTTLLVTLVLAGGALLGAGPVAASTKTPFNTNLVKNPGAEAGAGTSGNSQVTIPHWKGPNQFTVIRYGAPGFPAKSESTRISGGKKFFSCGQNSSGGYISQPIKLRGRQTLIDNGHVKVILKARLAVYDSQADAARAQVYFYNANAEIGAFATAEVTASDGMFIAKSATGIVPSGALGMSVELDGTRANNGGTYCDAYFDNISVVLKSV